MGLAHRIIPTFLVKGEMLVKGKAFSADRVVGHAAQAILIQAARGVDEVCILDVTAWKEGRGPNLKLIERLTDGGLFSPLSYGGGVRSLEDVREVLRAGADKVVIRSAGIRLVEQVAPIVGCQAIIAALDVIGLSGPVERGFDWVAAAQRWADAGAGEILLTRVEHEGSMGGYDLELIRHVAAAVDVPVIAHGGCGTYEHMREALDAGASAVAAGAMFQFTGATPRGAALFLQQHGIEVRV